MLNIAFCDDDKVFLNNIGLRAEKILKSIKEQASINLYTDASLLIKKFEK